MKIYKIEEPVIESIPKRPFLAHYRNGIDKKVSTDTLVIVKDNNKQSGSAYTIVVLIQGDYDILGKLGDSYTTSHIELYVPIAPNSLITIQV